MHADSIVYSGSGVPEVQKTLVKLPGKIYVNRSEALRREKNKLLAAQDSVRKLQKLLAKTSKPKKHVRKVGSSPEASVLKALRFNAIPSDEHMAKRSRSGFSAVLQGGGSCQITAAVPSYFSEFPAIEILSKFARLYSGEILKCPKATVTLPDVRPPPAGTGLF